VRGDVIPAGTAAPEDERANTGTRLVEPYKKPEEKSLMNKLKFWEKDEAAPAKEPAVKPDVKKIPETKALEPKVEAAVAESRAVSDADAAPSMLAVPLDVAVTPAVEASAQASIAVPAAVVTEVSPAPEPEMVKAPVAEVAAPVALPPVVMPDEHPVNATLYESASGMVFDRKLRSLPEEVEPEAVTAVAAPRVGNKVAPTPQDLPPESEPSFFDRMLEKIGF